MKKQYTYQDLETFFDQFKRAPEYITMEQVAQIVQHPSPAFTLPTKGASFRLWTILLTTTAVITVASILYFSSTHNKVSLGEMNPVKKEILPPVTNIPAMAIDTAKIGLQEASGQKTQQKAIEKKVTSMVTNETNQQLIAQKPRKTKKQELVAEAIDGNPYIIDDLSLDELRNLGFDIQHYTVFYRNTSPEVKCLYFSCYGYSIWYAKSIETMQSTGTKFSEENSILEANTLLKDTFPEEDVFYISIATKKLQIPMSEPENELYYYTSVNKNYYPVFVSSLDGEISGGRSIQEFEQATDSLVPVILPFSRLNCSQKKDLVFWFHVTDNFFVDIPERYLSLKSLFSENKLLKKANPEIRLINWDFDRWISERIFSPDKIIDGTGFILDLTIEEMERIGLHTSNENNAGAEFYYQTPWGHGSGMGGKWTNIKPTVLGGDSISVLTPDSILIVDFLPRFSTDTLGQTLRNSTTGKIIQLQHIEDDILVPVRVSNFIHWFTQSDSLWTLLPDRYKYLQEIYQKIFFTKSIYPDIDLVKYFEKGPEHIDMNVEIIDFNKSELEDLGFRFFKDSMTSQASVYNNEWIQFRINLPSIHSKVSEEARKRIIESIVKGYTQVVNENNKDWRKQRNGLEYDELIKSPYQGFQFVMITDEEGHELQRFDSYAREEYLSGRESQYLIPVRVPLDKYFSEYSETKIFWFTPTEAFFDRLPERIKKDLRKDYYSLTENSSNSTCTYFEECRSTLDLTEFSIYPNPAKESINISFNASEDVRGSISLLDIRGSIVKTLEAKAIIAAGNNKFSYSLDGLLPGIYLVAVHSEAGIKTGRLIVTE